MNLLAYTQKLYEKINFYDKIAKSKIIDNCTSNPFAEKVNITIIWIDRT